MPHHVVVDGSNLATEGRSSPSLQQLNEAVLAYMAEDPTALITVVVDATFGHRIDPKETAEFDDAVSNNELVAPPAGAIGRGDAFVLSIAHKVNADILTNDSYQEFHAQYDWLFDEGRLIGGKPVPHIGWVFVKRLPVRGPLSRKVTSEAKRKGTTAGVGSGGSRGRSSADVGTVRVGSPEANLPMPVPKSPPPRRVARVATAAEVPAKAGRGRNGRGRGGETVERSAKHVASAAPAVAAAPTGGTSTVNDLLSFLTFVERHPAGTSVNAIVDHYSSHGAYVLIGDMVGYVPLRLMAEPVPRSAREFMKVGESVTLIVESFVPTKRSVDLAIPGMGSAKLLGEAAPAKAAKAAKAAKPSKRAAKPGVAVPVEAVVAPAKVAAKPVRAAAKKSAGVPVAKPAATKAAKQRPAPAAAELTPVKAATKRATPTKVASPQAPASKAVPVKAVSAKAVSVKAVSVKAATAKATAPKKTVSLNSVSAKSAPAKSAPPRTVPARTVPATTMPAKSAAKTAAKTMPATTMPAKSAAAKSAASKKAAVLRVAATPAARRGRAQA